MSLWGREKGIKETANLPKKLLDSYQFSKYKYISFRYDNHASEEFPSNGDGIYQNLNETEVNFQPSHLKISIT